MNHFTYAPTSARNDSQKWGPARLSLSFLPQKVNFSTPERFHSFTHKTHTHTHTHAHAQNSTHTNYARTHRKHSIATTQFAQPTFVFPHWGFVGFVGFGVENGMKRMKL
jgi:hypothetical protein